MRRNDKCSVPRIDIVDQYRHYSKHVTHLINAKACIDAKRPETPPHFEVAHREKEIEWNFADKMSKKLFSHIPKNSNISIRSERPQTPNNPKPEFDLRTNLFNSPEYSKALDICSSTHSYSSLPLTQQKGSSQQREYVNNRPESGIKVVRFNTGKIGGDDDMASRLNARLKRTFFITQGNQYQDYDDNSYYGTQFLESENSDSKDEQRRKRSMFTQHIKNNSSDSDFQNDSDNYVDLKNKSKQTPNKKKKSNINMDSVNRFNKVRITNLAKEVGYDPNQKNSQTKKSRVVFVNNNNKNDRKTISFNAYDKNNDNNLIRTNKRNNLKDSRFNKTSPSNTTISQKNKKNKPGVMSFFPIKVTPEFISEDEDNNSQQKNETQKTESENSILLSQSTVESFEAYEFLISGTQHVLDVPDNIKMNPNQAKKNLKNRKIMEYNPKVNGKSSKKYSNDQEAKLDNILNIGNNLTNKEQMKENSSQNKTGYNELIDQKESTKNDHRNSSPRNKNNSQSDGEDYNDYNLNSEDDNSANSNRKRENFNDGDQKSKRLNKMTKSSALNQKVENSDYDDNNLHKFVQENSKIIRPRKRGSTASNRKQHTKSSSYTENNLTLAHKNYRGSLVQTKDELRKKFNEAPVLDCTDE